MVLHTDISKTAAKCIIQSNNNRTQSAVALLSNETKNKNHLGQIKKTNLNELKCVRQFAFSAIFYTRYRPTLLHSTPGATNQRM